MLARPLARSNPLTASHYKRKTGAARDGQLAWELKAQSSVTLFNRWMIPALLVAVLLAPPSRADDAAQRGTYRVEPNQRRSLGAALRGLFRPASWRIRATRGGIRRAHRRIKPFVDNLPTPLVKSDTLSRKYGVEVWLKLESQTEVGSFKIRGAMNKVRSLLPWKRRRGVVCASTGNHSQGVAMAAKKSGVPAVIFMPSNASELKAERTRGIGDNVEVKIDGEDYGASVKLSQRYASKKRMTFISGYADRKVIEGQGTIGKEIAEQVKLSRDDWVLSAVGGGGLLGGISSWFKGQKNRPRLIGVQSANNGAMALTLRSRPGARLGELPFAPTIADGTLVTKRPNPKMVELLRSRLDYVVSVPEPQVERAVLKLLKHTGHRIEGAGALPLAGMERVLAERLRYSDLRGIKRPAKVVLVLSGGNISDAKLAKTRAHHPDLR
jgi:threonine dehydratase